MIAVEVRDPRELELVNAGELWLVDSETGRHVRVDTRSARLRQRFAEAADAERREVASALAALGVRHTRAHDLRGLAAQSRRHS